MKRAKTENGKEKKKGPGWEMGKRRGSCGNLKHGMKASSLPYTGKSVLLPVLGESKTTKRLI